MNWCRGFVFAGPRRTAPVRLSSGRDLVEPPGGPHAIEVVAGAAHELILLESTDQRNPVCHNAVLAATLESNADRQLLELLASIHELAHVSLLHEKCEVGLDPGVVARNALEEQLQASSFDRLNDVGTATVALQALHGYPFYLAPPSGAVRCGCNARTDR